MNVDEPGFRGNASGEAAVAALSALIHEREKTKRLLIGVAFALFIVAAIVLIFAPDGREVMAYVLGGALIVIALGAIGASQFKIKMPGVVVETSFPDDARGDGGTQPGDQGYMGHRSPPK